MRARVTIDPNQYVTLQQKITRSTNKLQFQTYSTTKDYSKYGFFPQTIRTWNSLPASIVVPGQSLDQFKTLIQGYTNSISLLFFCTVYIHVIFYVYFENLSCLFSRCIIISIDGTSYKVEVESRRRSRN